MITDREAEAFFLGYLWSITRDVVDPNIGVGTKMFDGHEPTDEELQKTKDLLPWVRSVLESVGVTSAAARTRMALLEFDEKNRIFKHSEVIDAARRVAGVREHPRANTSDDIGQLGSDVGGAQ